MDEYIQHTCITHIKPKMDFNPATLSDIELYVNGKRSFISDNEVIDPRTTLLQVQFLYIISSAQ